MPTGTVICSIERLYDWEPKGSGLVVPGVTLSVGRRSAGQQAPEALLSLDLARLGRRPGEAEFPTRGGQGCGHENIRFRHRERTNPHLEQTANRLLAPERELSGLGKQPPDRLRHHARQSVDLFANHPGRRRRVCGKSAARHHQRPARARGEIDAAAAAACGVAG